MGQFALAENLLAEAVQIRRQTLGPDHVEVAASLSKLGSVPDLRARAVSRTFPNGSKNFEFEFPYKQYRNIILTSDSQACTYFNNCL